MPPPDPLRLHGVEPPLGAGQTVARLADRPEAGGPQPLLIGLAELAQLLGISRASAERMKASARLPRHVVLSGQMHRWRREDVEEWVRLGCPSRREFEARTGRGRA
jgi:predicted DNA-binding transcriptional regulator AlpA